MTEQQAKQIREMREQGIGYRSIALTVGLSRDIVRNFCKSRGLSGYGSALTKNIREQVMLGKACLYCGKEMKQPDTGRPKKFCSDKCRREWWKGHPERINRKAKPWAKPAGRKAKKECIKKMQEALDSEVEKL